MGIRTMTGTLGYIKIIYTSQGVYNTLIFYFFLSTKQLIALILYNENNNITYLYNSPFINYFY